MQPPCGQIALSAWPQYYTRLTKVWLMPLLLADSHDVHGIHIAASHIDQGSASQSSSLWDGSLATVPS